MTETEATPYQPRVILNLATVIGHTLASSHVAKLDQGLHDIVDGIHVLPFRGLQGYTPQTPVTFVEQPWVANPYKSFPVAVLAGLIGFSLRQTGLKPDATLVRNAFFSPPAQAEKTFQDLCRSNPDAYILSYDANQQPSQDPPNPVICGYVDDKNHTQRLNAFLTDTQASPIFFDPLNLDPQATSIPNEKQEGNVSFVAPWITQFNHMAGTGRLKAVHLSPIEKDDTTKLAEGGGTLATLTNMARRAQVPIIDIETPLPLYLQFPFMLPLALGFIRREVQVVRSKLSQHSQP